MAEQEEVVEAPEPSAHESESARYTRVRAERKARAAETVAANAKAAEEAKKKALSKTTSKSTKAYEEALEAKKDARASGYRAAH